MKKSLLGFLLIFVYFLISENGISQNKGPFYSNYATKNEDKITDFAVKGDLNKLKSNSEVMYKYSQGSWHYIRCTPSVLGNLTENKVITQIYFAPSFPKMLNDSMRLTQNIDSVGLGYAPLIDSFTGKGVIIGYVDTGVDWQHGDFLNEDGTTRVLRYWDHNLPYDAQRTPIKYGYGQVWTNTDIDNGICTSTDNHAHGTTVTGSGSGNANANGHFKGAAPNSDIIIVETNFNLANWTLTVADAIDYVFSVADSLGKPAIVNTSVGDYLGSHDGLDPASMIVDSLLNEKGGRLVVAAAGNSGAWGKYHLHGDVTTDTTFSWFEVNLSSGFGVPALYFDLWADTAQFNQVEFAMGADENINTPNFRGRTSFYNIQDILNTVQDDSIMNNGNKLAHVQYYTEEVNGVYHLEVYMESPDSSAYLYRFMTSGNGSYDVWSGTNMGLSNIISTNLPLVSNFPDIAYYQSPDTLMTTVSSWTCLPSVITVGNFANQLDYIDVNGDNYSFGHTPGKLSVNSSKGPNRLQVIKPDISATGDGTLSACPLFMANTTSNALAEGGLHVRNGGTSMACPVISGIAALYLEKCPRSTYADFKQDLISNAYSDNFTGITPNVAYGYGKVDAFKLLNSTNINVTLLGDTLICEDPAYFVTQENNFSVYDWSTDAFSSAIYVDTTDTISVIVENQQGCKALSDTIIVIKGTLPIDPEINIIGGGLVTTPAANHQWYLNNSAIDGANEQYYNPSESGLYYVIVYSPEGCSYPSDPISVDINTLTELNNNEFIIFPNPFTTDLKIIKNDYYDVSLIINDINGKLVYQNSDFNSEDLFISIDLSDLASGMYFLTIKYDNSYKTVKLVKE